MAMLVPLLIVITKALGRVLYQKGVDLHYRSVHYNACNGNLIPTHAIVINVLARSFMIICIDINYIITHINVIISLSVVVECVLSPLNPYIKCKCLGVRVTRICLRQYSSWCYHTPDKQCQDPKLQEFVPRPPCHRVYVLTSLKSFYRQTGIFK